MSAVQDVGHWRQLAALVPLLALVGYLAAVPGDGGLGRGRGPEDVGAEEAFGEGGPVVDCADFGQDRLVVDWVGG